MKASIRDLQTPEMVKPFAVEFPVRTTDDLKTLYHVVNMSRSQLASTINSNNTVPLPTRWFMFLNSDATDKCLAEIDRLGLKSNYTHDGNLAEVNEGDNELSRMVDEEDSQGRKQDCVGDLEWLNWEGRFMAPGIYQLRGSGFPNDDSYITISKGENGRNVITSWTACVFGFKDFCRDINTVNLEYRVITKF